MIGLIMTLLMLLIAFRITPTDQYLGAAFFGVAALFYLGFVEEFKRR